MKTFPVILGGVKKETGEILDVRFPYTGEIFAKVCQAGPDDLDEAVALAVRGFEKTRRLSSGARAPGEWLPGPAARPPTVCRTIRSRMLRTYLPPWG